MAVLQEVAPPVSYLVVDGEVGVAAEQFEAPLERLEQA